MGILSEMAMWRLVAVVAALALAVQAAPIEFGEARVDCAKAERANSVVSRHMAATQLPALPRETTLLGRRSVEMSLETVLRSTMRPRRSQLLSQPSITMSTRPQPSQLPSLPTALARRSQRQRPPPKTD